MKKTLTILVGIILIATTAFSQETEESLFSLDLGADMVSKYVWRGAQFGQNVPALQPFVELSAGPIVLGFFGSTGLAGNNSFQEFDIYLGANFADDMFSVYVFDYYFPGIGADYFDYNETTTGHIFEADFSFNGTEKLPLSLLFAVNFYGDDVLKIESDVNSPSFNESAGIKYSSYVELGYTGTVNNVEFSPFIGANLTSAAEIDLLTGYIGENGFYGENVGLVHVGVKVVKEIKVTESFSLPLSVQISTNPETKSVYWVMGMSF